MINTIEVLKSEEFGEIRTVSIDGEPYFVGKDVAEALGYKDVKHAVLDHVDAEDRINSKTRGQNDPEFGQRGTWLINENGLYNLILSSKNPNAKQFRQWITAELMERAGTSAEPTEETPKSQVLPSLNGSLEVFSNAEFGTIRTVVIDGEPWFVGKDVALALGYGDDNKDSKALTNALKDHVDDEDKQLLSYNDFKGYQNGDLKNISHYGAIVINESGLYSLILSSKLPSAKKFKHWITAEVIPSIRKHGVYMTDNLLDAVIDNPEVMIGVVERLKAERRIEQDKLAALENELVEAMPKAVYYDTFVDPGYALCFRDTAKELGFSQKEFIKLLIDHKFIYRNSRHELRPMSGSFNHGLFILRDYTNIKNRHRGTYTLVTAKGKKYLYEYFNKKGII